jgi:Chondroitinase B
MSRTFAEGSKLTVRYRKVGDASWKSGHALLRIRPEWSEAAPTGQGLPVAAFAGSLFDLTPDSTYELELTLQEPGQATRVMTTSASTRALPPAAGAVTKVATPTTLRSVLNGINPGDVVELDNGAYNNLDFYIDRSGTAAQPIYIRGKTRTGVVVSNGSKLIQLRGASHLIIENMTLRGSGVDSGTAASSQGIQFHSGWAGQSFVTLRDLDITGVDVGVIADAAVNSVLVYNCKLTGNNTWTQSLIETNATWNDDGLRLPGQGNVAFENTLYGFGDSFAVAADIHSAAVHFYRNLVKMTGDDAFEADYGTRNLSFYDNHISNCGTLLSMDPVYGGPLYCFRNVVINSMRGPYKLNSQNSGFLIYNNTVVRTEGRTGWGWVQFNNGSQENWAYVNNLLIYRGTTGKVMAIESTGMTQMDFSNNGWFPNGQVWWSSTGGSYGTVSEAIASGVRTHTPLFGTATRRHVNDVVTTADPFAQSVVLGPNHLTEVTTTYVPALVAGSSPKAAGLALSNVTDGFSGTAPDMGAIITGRALPRWGAAR